MFDRSAKVKSLEIERDKLKEEISDLKIQKKIEQEDIKHMVRLKEEKDLVIHERQKLEMENEKQKAINVVRDEYRDKLEKRLEVEVANMKEMYNQILARLPNINVKGKI